MSANNKSMLHALELIREDMRNDVIAFDHAPLSGKTVGTIHGNLAAAIDALAAIMTELIKREVDKV